MKWKAIYLYVADDSHANDWIFVRRNEVSDEMGSRRCKQYANDQWGTTPQLHPLFSDGHVYDWIECTGQWFDNVGRPCTHANPAIIFHSGMVSQ